MSDENTIEKQEKPPSKLKILLATMRAEKGMSAKKMAEVLGFTSPYLSQVETGHTVPSTKLIKNCVEIFELSPERAFELFTAAYEQQHSITLDFNEIIKQDILDKESLARLLSVLTIGQNLKGRQGIKEILFKGLRIDTAIDGSPCVERLNKAIDEVWEECFAKFLSKSHQA